MAFGGTRVKAQRPNHTLRRTLLAVLMALGGAFVGASPAAAGDTRCGIVPPNPDEPPAPTPEYFANFEFLIGGTYDNIVVPEGTWCFALDVDVRGNVLVEQGSKLNVGTVDRQSTIGGNAEAKQDAHINIFASSVGGNYTCDQCLFLGSFDNRIGGNVEVDGARLDTFIGFSVVGGNVLIGGTGDGVVALTVIGNQVAGNMTVERNHGAGEVLDNQIGGNVEVSRNAGPLRIARNAIDGSLDCFRNLPPATSEDNTAVRSGGECEA